MTSQYDSDLASASLRSLAILDAIVEADRPISLAQIAEQLQLPKPTVFRLLGTLEKSGWVFHQPAEKDYVVGARLAQFGLRVMTNDSVRAMRHAILARLASTIGETCNITMLDNNEVVYMDRVETQWPLKIDLQAGTRVPLHCSASGKLMLSQMGGAKRRILLENMVLTRFTDHTITDLAALEAELGRTRAERIGIDNEEYLDGLVCVAVPVYDGAGKLAAALAVQAPTARFSLEQARAQVPVLMQAAAALGETFAAPKG